MTNDQSPLSRLAGALLLSGLLFGLAAVVAFGSLGRQASWGWGFAGAGLLCLAGWLLGRGRRAQARDASGRQRALLGANALLSIVLLLCVLAGLNFLANRRHKTFDLTSNRVNSLAEQSVRALQKLPSPVRLTYVYVPQNGQSEPDAATRALLNAFQNASDKVRVEYLNALADPARFERLNVPDFGQGPLLLAALEPGGEGGARQQVRVANETNVTSALLRLAQPQSRTLYFLTGHGEAGPSDVQTPQGLALVGAALGAQNYQMQGLSLLGAKAKVPPDAAALIVAGPRSDLSQPEDRLLRAYAAKRGRLVVLLAPTRERLPRWNALVKSWGVDVVPGLVSDAAQSYQRPVWPLGPVGDREAHPLLRGLAANSVVVFPLCVPLRPLAGPSRGWKAQGVFETSPQSQTQPLRAGEKPQPGPFWLAVALEREGTRLLLAGNTSFAGNANAGQFANRDFLLACVNWVVGDEALISIPPKPPVTNTIQLPDASARFAVLFSLLALPLLILLAGGAVWWKRR